MSLHRGYSLGEASARGKTILDFSLVFVFIVVKTCLKK